eukprot:4489628-Prymnesium_polylepis.1
MGDDLTSGRGRHPLANRRHVAGGVWRVTHTHTGVNMAQHKVFEPMCDGRTHAGCLARDTHARGVAGGCA